MNKTNIVVKKLLLGILFSPISFLCAQTLPDLGNLFLDKDKRPIAFSNKDVVLSESWIKQRETVSGIGIKQFAGTQVKDAEERGDEDFHFPVAQQGFMDTGKDVAGGGGACRLTA